MRTATLACLLLLVLAAPLRAQHLSQGVLLIPRLGMMGQAAPFQERFDDPPPEYRQVWRYRLQPDLALGGALELHPAGLPVGLRLDLGRASSLVLEREPGNPGPPLHGAAEGTVSTATLAVVVEPAPVCGPVLCPRLVVGGGLKRYQFDADLLFDDIVEPFAGDQTRATLHLGAGLRVKLWRIALLAEVNDYSNRVSFGRDNGSGRAHDTVASIGVVVPLR